MKKNYFLMLCSLLLGVTMQAQSGNGHNPSLVLSYTPSGYSSAASMRQDNGYLSFSKNTINNNGGGTDLFLNFEFDTSGKNVWVVYTTNGTEPSQSNGTQVSATFSAYNDPNRTWIATIPSSVNSTAGTVVKYLFYISDGAIGASWGIISNSTGYANTWSEGSETGYSYTVYDSNVSAGGNWNSTTTWNSGSIPNSTAMPVEIIGNNTVTLNQNASTENLNILSSATLEIESGNSLIVNGTSTGNITYNINVNDTNWHLMSSPLEGEGYDTSWVDANLIDNTTRLTGTNVGIATYDNTADADGDWIYATDGSTGTFNTGQGYSIKRDATGSDIAFIGTLKTNDASIAITANDVGGANENRWTLIGNPFSSYIDINALLTNAGNQSALEDSREAIYVWNGSSYQALTTGYIHPGQGFFVNSNTASESISITQAMLSHQTSVTFYKTSNPDVTVNLMVFDGIQTKSTKINYLSDKTAGLDPRFDIGTFTGTSTSFNLFTRLVENDNGVDFMRQAVSQDYENMVIPVGVKVAAGKEITFTAEAMNLPEGIKVFLEDRENNSFNELTSTNNYKVTVNNALNGSGRFFLHTRSAALSTDDVALTGIGMYALNKNTLRISGVNSTDASIKVFNILGSKVVDKNFASKGVYDVSLPNLNTGVYIVQLSTEKGKLSKKIVLE